MKRFYKRVKYNLTVGKINVYDNLIFRDIFVKLTNDYSNCENCYICHDTMGRFDDLASCSECRKIVHYECLEKWFNSDRAKIKKCPHCIKQWDFEVGKVVVNE